MMSNKDNFDEFVAVLSKAIAEARRLLLSFKVVPRTREYKLFALIVLNELVRKCESVDAMAEAGAYGGINVVVRAAFENYADLINIFKYKSDYVNYMIWASFNQGRSRLEPMTAANPSRFVEPFKVAAKETVGKTPGEMLADTRRNMEFVAQVLPARFKDKNGKVQKRDVLRFELADKVDEYDILYRHLSSGAHGRVSAMVEGIMHGDAIHWPPSDSVNPPWIAVDSLCAMLLESCERMAKPFNRPEGSLKRLAREHAAIRGGEFGVIPSFADMNR